MVFVILERSWEGAQEGGELKEADTMINFHFLSGKGSSPHTKRNSIPRTLISRTFWVQRWGPLSWTCKPNATTFLLKDCDYYENMKEVYRVWPAKKKKRRKNQCLPLDCLDLNVDFLIPPRECWVVMVPGGSNQFPMAKVRLLQGLQSGDWAV